MRRIYKWPLDDTTQVPWSPGDRVLLIADQAGPTLWAEQEDSVGAGLRRFIVVGTGWPVPPDTEHVGSTVCGQFVWHIYADPVGP